MQGLRVHGRFGRQAVAWLLTLLLLLGHDLGVSPRSAPASGIWAASDICSVGSEGAKHSPQSAADHGQCVFHCGTGAPALAPDALPDAADRPLAHLRTLPSTHHAPPAPARRTAHAPRAPPSFS